jgi:glucuronyl/N-acetylglucosaminyl transferase EXT2
LASLTRTSLDILNDRIFTAHAKNYLDWNIFPNLQSPLFLPQTSPASVGFTAVILTYDRLESLYAVISRVAEVPSLAQILVVWNNQVQKDC